MGLLKSLFETKYDIRLNIWDSLIVCIGVLYLLIAVDAYFLWNYKGLITVVVCFLLFLTLPYLSRYRDFGLSKTKMPFFVSYLIYVIIFVIQWTPDSANYYYVISSLLSFLPLFLLVLWPKKFLYGTYRLFFKIVVFFSIGSIIISILGIFSLLDFVPYVELDAHEALHENSGVYYRVYCGFLTDYGGIVDYFLIRACGFLCEPGHWAITLGLIYVIERLQGHTPNVVIVICGLFTFSSVFIIVLIITELCIHLRKGNYLRFTFISISVLLSFFIIYNLLPSSIKDPIDEVFLERNLSDFGEALSEGTLDEAFDTRANNNGLDYYYRHIKSGNLLWGDGQIIDEDFILSDYRAVLIQQGIIGLVLIIMTVVTSTKGLSLRNKIPLLTVLVIVILHRVWMFHSAYLCLMVFVGNIVISTNQRKLAKQIVGKKNKKNKHCYHNHKKNNFNKQYLGYLYVRQNSI